MATLATKVKSKKGADVSLSTKKTGRPRNEDKIVQAILHFLPQFRETPLTIQEAQFAIEYATNGFDAPAAYTHVIDKRLTPKTAEVRANNLLKKEPIRQAVVDILTAWLNEKKIRLEREVIQSLYIQAFYDPSDFMNVDGAPIFSSWDEIPKPYRICVESIEPKGPKFQYPVIKLVDRRWALERLTKLITLTQAPSPSTPTQQQNPQTSLLMSQETSLRLQSIFGSVQ